jgi:Trehalose utilisation
MRLDMNRHVSARRDQLLRGALIAATLTLAFAGNAMASGKVLIVADERPAMEALARYLEQHGRLETRIVEQNSMPQALRRFDAVIVYIHNDLDAAVETQLIDYTRAGGRLVPLHHSISSAKARNRYWLDFLAVQLPGAGTPLSSTPTVPGGHYAWREGITQTIVNVNPAHYITSHDIRWPETTSYVSSSGPALEASFPAYSVVTETYINHYFTDGAAKTVLLGFKYHDDRNDTSWMQDRAGWTKAAGAGQIVYLQSGHFAAEFRDSILDQMILNAIRWKPAS